MKKDEFRSALSVNRGVPQPPSVDSSAVNRFLRHRKKLLRAADYLDGILHRDIGILSQAITLVESSLPAHAQLAQEILELCLPHSGGAIRIGITGVPGAGKSTFIESLGTYLTHEKQRRLAVLAIDPSSERSGGSILGDKTRMEKLAADPNAFIRPSPSSGSLGGVARKTREISVLCEAAGFDTLLIETVGVGQSETAVHSMTDFFLLLQIAGAGDELQGIKRGIMEMADAILINKADGDNLQRATLAKAQYENALHLFPKSPSGWKPEVKTCSSLNGVGIPEIWEMISRYDNLLKSNGFLDTKRREQARYWMNEFIRDRLLFSFYHHPSIKSAILVAEQKVLSGNTSPFRAAQELLDQYEQLAERKNKENRFTSGRNRQ